MARVYSSYAEAIAEGTRCQFALPFSFSLPSITFPPPIPIPDLIFTIPSPPFACPLDRDPDTD